MRFRLNLMILSIMALIVTLGAALVIHNARRAVLEEIHSSVNLALQLIEAGAAREKASKEQFAHWLLQINRLEEIRHLKIQIQRTEAFNGAADDGVKGDGQARSQGVRAKAPGWFIWAIAPEPLMVEKRIAREGGEPIHILIEADPTDEIAEVWNEARNFLGLVLIMALMVYGLVHIALGRAFRSVEVILKGLQEIESGNYGERLPDFSLPEFARISQAFNHTASALEKAREENRALTQRSLAIQEEERRCLAQELHDELGQSLSAIKAMAVSMRNSKPSGEIKGTVDSIISVCNHLFSVVRAMMRRLRPIMLDELGLIASLEDMLENWRARHPEIGLTFTCEESVEDCEKETKIQLFRIIQECLTNVVKHARADRVEINLEAVKAPGHSAYLCLQIEDNGCGFDPKQPRKGFGLLGIRERVKGLGGEFQLESRPGRGTAINIKIPYGVSHERQNQCHVG